jgi:ATP-dependent DNA helicase RecG
MPIDLRMVNQSEVDRILGMAEDHFHDVKSSQISPAKLTESISSFANADGGTLYVGVTENKATGEKSWEGFETIEAANGHIQIFEELFPLGDGFQYTFLTLEGDTKCVLQVEVLKSPSVRKASNGTVYLRRSAQKLPQKTEEQLTRLRLNKGLFSFEDEAVNIPLSFVENSISIIEFMLNVIPHGSPEEWLTKQQLVRDKKPNVAAVLLFADEPQIAIRYSNVKIYYYNTLDDEGTRETLEAGPITIEGSLYNQTYEAVDKAIEIVEGIPILAENGLEKINYPKDTIHEIITNAIIHRDYSINDSVHIRIFNNRIEIVSPGTLPAHVTEKNFLRTRFSRNPTIVNLINKFPNAPNKNIGEGLNTAFNAMRKLNLRVPKLSQENNYVSVVIKHERLAKSEELIMEYLRTNAEVTNKIAREVCFIGSENVVKNIFIKLMANNQIEKVPGKFGSATAYRRIRQ